MISAIGSGSSSPIQVYRPEYVPEIQDSSASSQSGRKVIRTGIAECRDSFESAPATCEEPYDNQVQHLEYKLEYKLALIHPIVNPATDNSSLAADLTVNMLSMIRV